MKKIGLVTYYNSDNYGAMLQAFALQKEIERNGCRCVLVSHDRFSVQKKELAKAGGNRFSGLLKRAGMLVRYPRSIRMMAVSRRKDIKRGKIRQQVSCAAFREKYFPNRTEIFYYTTDQIMKDPPVFDGYVCGSDQIWNPERFRGAAPFFLAFAPEGRNRIAYAPSLAMTSIPDEFREDYRKYLSAFSDLSVREGKGCEAIEKATGFRPECVLDPTFLLLPEEWESFSDVVADAPEKYIFCYFLGKENLLRARTVINNLARKLDAEVVILPYGGQTADRRWKSSLNVGAREFTALIRKAQYVLTDSFHGTSLSILLGKDFNVYSGLATATFANRFDRIGNILRFAGLEGRAFTGLSDLDTSVIDYDAVRKNLTPLMEKSRRYLQTALEKVGEQKPVNKPVPALASRESCTGCSACTAACPCGALGMRKDKAGFWRPEVSDEKCIHCGKCESVCPVRTPADKNTEPPEYKAVYASDPDFRIQGSSGNAFGLLAKAVLRQKGEVFGAALSEDCRKLSFRAASEVGLEKLQKSKYFEADMGDVIPRIKVLLDQGIKVMFTGTPCQAAGVRKTFGDHPSLLICDFLCHGVSSAEWFGRYLTALEEKYHSQAIRAAFRSKALGWRLYCMKIDFANGKQYLKTRYADPYYLDFFKNRHLRTNCYSCSRAVYSYADITFGDYWAVKVKRNMEDSDEGISLVCLRTEKAKEFFASETAELSDWIRIQSLTPDEVDESLLVKTRKPPKGHDVLPEHFPMHPHLSGREKIQRLYYEMYIKPRKRYQRVKTAKRQ